MENMIRIGEIAIKRNEIQCRRQSIRQKLYRAERIYSFRKHAAEKARLEKATDIKSYKKFNLIDEKITELLPLLSHYTANEAILDAFRCEKNIVQGKIDKAQDLLKDCKFSFHGRLPEKHLKTPMNDLKLNVLQLQHQMSGVVLELAEFTKATHKELRRLLKKEGLVMMQAHGQNKVDGFRKLSDRGEYTPVLQLEKMVIQHKIETILLENNDE